MTISNEPIGTAFGQGWLSLLYGGMEGSAGININRNSILSSPFWFRGINLISSTIARLPFQIYRRGKDGGRLIDEKHFAYNWLNYPNPFVTRHDLLRTAVASALTFGNGYIRVKYSDPYFEPVLAYVLDAEQTIPIRMKGNLFYETRASSSAIIVEPDLELGSIQTLQPHEVIHIRGYSFDGLVGVPVISILRDALSSGIGLQKYLNTFLKRGGSISKQILIPGTFKDSEELEAFKKGFDAQHENLDGSHKTPIFQGGAKIDSTGSSNSEAELVAQREFEIKVIAAVLGLPPHLLGSISSSSYGSLEQENRSVLIYSFEPWLASIESEFNLKVLSTTQQKTDSHYFAFNRNALERGDITTETNAILTQLNAGLLSLNQALALKDLPGIGPDGDKHRMASNLTFQELAANPPPEPVEITDQPVTDDSQDVDEDSTQDDQESKLQRQLETDVKRLITRLDKAFQSKQGEPRAIIKEHETVIRTALPSIDHTKITAWLNDLGEELSAVTTNQIPAVFARQRPSEIVRKLWTN